MRVGKRIDYLRVPICTLVPAKLRWWCGKSREDEGFGRERRKVNTHRRCRRSHLVSMQRNTCVERCKQRTCSGIIGSLISVAGFSSGGDGGGGGGDGGDGGGSGGGGGGYLGSGGCVDDGSGRGGSVAAATAAAFIFQPTS